MAAFEVSTEDLSQTTHPVDLVVNSRHDDRTKPRRRVVEERQIVAV